MNNQNVSRQVRRAEERKIVRAALSKIERRTLQKMKNPRRNALKKMVIEQYGQSSHFPTERTGR